MHNFILMTVVHGEEDLTCDDCSIFLSEFLSGNKFIIELTTSANFRHNVKALLVFKELKNLDDIRMIQLLENINFVHHLASLLLVHMLLVKGLDCPLSASVSMHTLTYLTESSLSEHVAYFVHIS